KDEEDEQGASKDDTESEIQSIMDQFAEGLGMGEDEIMSPRLEKAGPLLSSPNPFPPRRSSLAPIEAVSPIASHTTDPEKSKSLDQVSEGLQDIASLRRSSIEGSKRASQVSEELSEKAPWPDQSRSSSHQSTQPAADRTLSEQTNTSSRPPSIQSKQYKAPPPAPDPEPDLPFDFHRFLEQLRHRTADPVAKFLRSFLFEFGKKQWMVHEQVKIISDFLEFISKKMAQCEVWRTVSDAEFDNAREGMEKLVMNRLYSQCFSPAIPLADAAPERAGKRKQSQAGQQGPGRRGQHQEDVERDEVLAQKVRIYGWVREEHLDIPPIGEKGRKFMDLAQKGMYCHPH
ncbi:MAG: hypothetical protein INR71_12045, partial [Terriglobus roseus]|nr:hypothetical protein [Terriglobus roseus]